MRPLIVRQITGVSQFAAVIAPAVLCRPHRWPSSNQATTLESQPIQGIQYVSGQTLRGRAHESDEQFLKRMAPSLFCPLVGNISAVQLLGRRLAEVIIWKITEFA